MILWIKQAVNRLVNTEQRDGLKNVHFLRTRLVDLLLIVEELLEEILG